MSLNLERARFNMIEQQVRPWDVLDARVLAVLGQVQRELYVSDAHRQLAFADLELPLAHGEFMMKPVVEGRVLQALDVQPGDSVLEIGTGSGFLTACLARLGRDVTSVEQHADLAATARERLLRDGITNAKVEVAEAVREFQPGREFDAVVLTGAVCALPERFAAWLKARRTPVRRHRRIAGAAGHCVHARWHPFARNLFVRNRPRLSDERRSAEAVQSLTVQAERVRTPF